ncbi:MAG: hypothetical protein R3Y59_03065 [bacterium]
MEIASLDYAKILCDAGVKGDNLETCEKNLKDIKSAWANWTNVDILMQTSYNTIKLYKKYINDSLGTSALIISDIINAKGNIKDNKVALLSELSSLEMFSTKVISDVNSACDLIEEFGNTLSGSKDKMSGILDIYVAETAATQSAVDELNKKVDSLNKAIKDCEIALWTTGAVATATPFVCAFACILFPVAAVIIVPVGITVEALSTAGVITAGVLLNKRMAELEETMKNLNDKNASLTTLVTGKKSVEESYKDAKNIIGTYAGIKAPWEAIKTDVSKLIKYIDNPTSIEVDFHELLKNIEEAISLWQTVVDNTSEMKVFEKDKIDTITVDDLLSDSRIKALILRFSASA